MPNIYHFRFVLAGALTLASTTATAQVRLDRADPTITEQALPLPKPVARPDVVTSRASLAAKPITATASTARTVTAIEIVGRTALSPALFSPTYAPYLGRPLSRDQLAELAGKIAATARAQGYPLATASIEPSDSKDGVLKVALDDGRVDAVRVIGATSPAADAILTNALVTDHAVRRSDLERAIGLVSDLPGVIVTESRLLQENGFNILLVTIGFDRVSAYAQFDNRGSDEVGPVRSTMIANVRGLAQSGDELTLIAAQTPFQPSEFFFLRGRYSAPVGHAGGVLSASASYGRSKPGASLKPLDVIGRSVDVAVSYSNPIVRSRTRSLWGALEFRAIKVDQDLAGARLRDDRLATLTGSLNGTSIVPLGTLRGELGLVAGLPLDGVSHENDPRTSRSDGDARFVAATYAVDWTAHLAKRLNLVLASAGQIASRPLLATMEIGAGGPAFGRGYDYAERTGDNGVLGSAEVRADAGRIVPGWIDRLQVYGFFDGGYVDNLRNGFGGGSLLSTGGGARLGTGRLDGMVEIALPMNADRFDTGDRSPRISLRIARSF